MISNKEILTYIQIFAENLTSDLINSVERNDFRDTTALLTTIEADVIELTNIIKVELTVAGYAQFLVNGRTKKVPRKRQRPELRAKRINSKAFNQPLNLQKYTQSIVATAIKNNLEGFYKNMTNIDKQIQNKINQQIKDYNFKINL